MRKILVTGAGGFIGNHLVKRLAREGNYVAGVDLKYPEFDQTEAEDFWIADLRRPEYTYGMCDDFDDVYQLAADMGGIGYISKNLADISANNVLINVNMLREAARSKVKRYLYTSSACVYPHGLQTDADVKPLREEDAVPSQPEPGYGEEKLFSERLTEYFGKDHGLDVRIVRFHNVYGPLGTYDGGREKSPAALCRKVAKAESLLIPPVDGYEDVYGVEIWGDGQQTRTYLYIEDCIEGLRRIMESGYQKPLNLGTNEIVTIDELAYIIGDVAEKKLLLTHVEGPQGVRGRSSDNTRIREVLGWEPTISLAEGIKKTYDWIANQVNG